MDFGQVEKILTLDVQKVRPVPSSNVPRRAPGEPLQLNIAGPSGGNQLRQRCRQQRSRARPRCRRVHLSLMMSFHGQKTKMRK